MATQKNAPDLSKKKTADVKESSPESEEIPVVEEKYFEVYFLDKMHDDDLEYHYLAVNGEALQVTKGTNVIVPERFLVVADNALIKQYKKGKVVGEVSRVPYRLGREATKEEFLKMKREGTKKHKADLEDSLRGEDRDRDREV